MEPLKIIVSALVEAAAAVSKETVSQAVKDSYAALKGLIIHKLSAKSDIENALKQWEKKPESEHRQGMLEEELESAHADKVSELIDMAIEILDLLKREDLCSNISYSARQKGMGVLFREQKQRVWERRARQSYIVKLRVMYLALAPRKRRSTFIQQLMIGGPVLMTHPFLKAGVGHGCCERICKRYSPLQVFIDEPDLLLAEATLETAGL